MEKLDPYTIFGLGAALHPIHQFKHFDYSLKGGTSYGDAERVLILAEMALSSALDRNALNLETSLEAGKELLIAIRGVRMGRTEEFSKRAEQLDPIRVGLLHELIRV